jgi:GT2 family glycosyltransferase
MTAYGIAHHLSIPYAATLNFAIKRSYLLELGGFNEAYQTAGGEDRELCRRITQMGETIHFVPRAMVIHAHPRNDLTSARRHIYQYGLSQDNSQDARNNRTIMMRIAIALAKIPIIGELGGAIRVLFRAFTRLGNIGYLKKAFYLPGIMYLDLCHTYGIIKALREYDS